MKTRILILLAALLVAVPAHAAPPPDQSPRFTMIVDYAPPPWGARRAPYTQPAPYIPGRTVTIWRIALQLFVPFWP